MDAIGKYQVVRELGKGASGKVYLATDPFGDRQVAIKVAFPDALRNAENGPLYRKMFLNEAALAGKLKHPHVVEIFDAVVDERSSYIVMEYVEGGTLERFCVPGALLVPADVVEMIFKCARALAFAQDLGLTHRDIKPGNILYVEGTDIKIADFGASINVVSDRTVIANVGSPAYMAPELITGVAQASALTDIYSLGVVTYYLLTGHLPFSGGNTMSVIYQIVNTEPEAPGQRREGLPADLEAIVLRAMAKDPAHRFTSWEEFAQALAEVMKRLRPVEEPEPTDSERFNLCRGLPFFREFPEKELWEVLRISKWRRFPVGTTLIKEGDQGDSFFILAGGYVRVTRGERTLSVLAAGECFGEMAYLARKKSPNRSATVTTASDCLVVKIRAEDLSASSLSCRLRFDDRFFDTLVTRLDTTNEQLALLS